MCLIQSLALVLVLLGILLVRARSFINKMGCIGMPLQRYLPLASTVIVTLLGADILLQGLIVYI